MGKTVLANLAAIDGSERLPPQQDGETGPEYAKRLFDGGFLAGSFGKGSGAGSALAQLFFGEDYDPAAAGEAHPSHILSSTSVGLSRFRSTPPEVCPLPAHRSHLCRPVLHGRRRLQV